jgi:hypothetical protein
MRTGPVTKDVSTVALGLAQIRVGASAANVSNANACLTSADSMGAMADTKLTSAVEYWKLTSGFPALEDLSLPTSETCSFECAFKEITPKNMALARGLDPFSVGAGVAASPVAVIASSLGTVADDVSKPIVCASTCAIDTFTVKFSSATAYTLEGFNTGAVTGAGTVGSESTFQISAVLAITIPANKFTGTWANGDRARFSTSKTGYSDNHAGEINLGGMKAPEFIRMEAVYTYPNGTNHMYIIFPRANVSSNLEIAFSASDNAAPTITFEAKRADSEVSGGNAVWDSKPLGRVYWD